MIYTLADCVAANASAFPRRTAIEVLDPRIAGSIPIERLTYRDVWARIERMADAIGTVERGANGAIASLLLPNGTDHVAAYLATQVAGAAALSLNGRWTETELATVLDDSGSSLIIAGPPHLDIAHALAEPRGIRVLDVRTIDDTSIDATWLGPSTREDADNLAVVAYTSGANGRPHCTGWTNGDWLTRLFQWGWGVGLSRDHVLSVPGPLCHLSYGGLALGMLAVGASVRIMASFDADVAVDEYREHANATFLVPSMIAMIADAWRRRGRPPLLATRRTLTSGAPFPLPLIDTAFDMFPNASITEAYGWTEGGWVTFEVKERDALVDRCVGWPIVGAEVGVRHPSGAAVDDGELGEVVARTLVPFRGYLNDPAASAAALTADGFVRSGDIGRWLDDGRLVLVDRVADMIISGGLNVFAAEVERVLTNHPAVAEAAVFGVMDRTWGERVTAAVVLRDPEVGVDELIAHCRTRLAAYKCPREIVTVPMLPRGATGAVHKSRLAAGLGRR